MDTLSLTTLETMSLTGPLYLGFVAAFVMGLGVGVFLGSVYVSVKHE